MYQTLANFLKGAAKAAANILLDRNQGILETNVEIVEGRRTYFGR